MAGSDGNFVRRKTDYLVMLVILGCMFAVSNKIWPDAFTPQEEINTFQNWIDPIGLEDFIATSESAAGVKEFLAPIADTVFNGMAPGRLAVWLMFFAVTSIGMHAITWGCLMYFRWSDPKNTCMDFFWPQARTITTNFILLPIVQTFFDAYFQNNGLTKVTTAGLESPLTILRDALLWMLCFEWAWYFQHRAMHDVKFLWVLGHRYHHTFRRPEHMIGVTNFAFDHIVEVWVTMSSSFLGFFVFPCNFFTGKAIGLAYMILAVFAHWEGFRLSRYHINHHYLVTKNYGSHVPIFDLLFGTYEYRAEYPGKKLAKMQ